MRDNRKLGGLDYFKLFAAFLVIAIHTSPLSSFSSSADFIFTRILARMAVPFFLMVTGYFLLPQYLFEHIKDFRPLFLSIKKTLLLYAAAIVLYLPVNFYAGQLHGANIFDFFRMLVFDGTLYHLWYLPASVIGVLLVILMSRKLSFRAIVGIALVLYGFGLLGDSYFGFVSNSDLLREIYEAMFRVFSYTRNGIFYAPVFLVMGAGMKKIQRGRKKTTIMLGFVLSVLLMICEGLTLNHLDVQRHDSMYICLLPCMYFLFQIVLSVKKSPVKPLRTISTWIYIIHPLFIVLVRGAAKFTHLESIFIENSIAHYITVSLLSCAFAVFWQKVSEIVHKQPFDTARAWIELDMDNLRHNVLALKGLLPQGSELMPAVKANAYGHGAVLISKELNRLGIKSFCVAAVSEGIELRRNGVKGDILVLGYTHPEQFSMLRKYQLTQAVIDYSYARLLNSYGKKLKVHLKIDTGMHRLGERSEQIDKINNIFSCKNLDITGAFTHLCSDETRTEPDMKYTMAQATAFYDVISALNERGCFCGKVHLLASYGLINYAELGGDYARIGIALYGVLSNRADLDSCPIELRPVLSIKARIALTKDLYAGEAAGYGLQYVAESDRKIAALSIGYADGIPRALSCGHGKVLINGSEAPIVGRICMDQMLVDITDIPNVKSGDVAVLVGKSGQHEITAYDLAEESGTITNELLSRLGSRLNRIAL